MSRNESFKLKAAKWLTAATAVATAIGAVPGLTLIAQAAAVVTYSADTTVSLGNGDSLTIVSGSTAQEVVVDETASTIAVTVDSGDSFVLKSPNMNQIPNDGGYGACTLVSGVPQVTVTASVPTTVTFSPTLTECSSGTTGGGGGGGGGGSSSSTTTAAAVTITAPTSGSSWTAGASKTITWSTSGNGIDTIEIDYSADGGDTYTQVAYNLSHSLSSYAWTVPNVSTSDAMIKLVAYDTGKAKLTSSTVSFKVAASSTSTPASSSSTVETTEDAEGRNIAPGSGDFGTSPFDGTEGEISQVQTGWYVRGYGSSSVYYIDSDFVRHPFWDTNTFFTYVSSFNDVVWVSDATLPTLTFGSAMLPKAGVVLVKIQSDPKVYAIEDDSDGNPSLRWVPSEDVAITLYGAAWADYVIDLDPTVFSKFTSGSDMTASDSVSKSSMKTRVTLSQEASS